MSDQPRTRAGRRWMFAALFVFIFFLLLWIGAAFLLNSAYAESLPFSLGLRSRLAANYSPDEFSGSQGVFRLSIFNEVFHDLGLSPEEAEERSEEIKIAMGSPVPTATARNFEGDDPFTATPTPQPTSTATTPLTETPSPTRTRRPMKTPKPTKEPKIDPSDTPAPVFTATKTPTTKCWVNPIVEILDPPDGAVYYASDDIPAQAFAYDPDNVSPADCVPNGVYPSDDGVGISKVEFKFYWVDGGDVLVHSQDQVSVKYCGFTGTSSCDTHPVNSPYWPDGFTPINDGLHRLKVKAKDDGGNYSDWVWVYFTINTGPAPTPTPTSTSTATSTPTATATATATATPTPTNTPVNVCSNISIDNFVPSGSNDATWDLVNSNGFSVTISHIEFWWPSGNGDLNIIEVNSSTIWSGGDDAPYADLSLSGLVPDGGPHVLRFNFDDSVGTSGYNLIATFDGVCNVSVSVP